MSQRCYTRKLPWNFSCNPRGATERSEPDIKTPRNSLDSMATVGKRVETATSRREWANVGRRADVVRHCGASENGARPTTMRRPRSVALPECIVPGASLSVRRRQRKKINTSRLDRPIARTHQTCAYRGVTNVHRPIGRYRPSRHRNHLHSRAITSFAAIRLFTIANGVVSVQKR